MLLLQSVLEININVTVKKSNGSGNSLHWINAITRNLALALQFDCVRKYTEGDIHLGSLHCRPKLLVPSKNYLALLIDWYFGT